MLAAGLIYIAAVAAPLAVPAVRNPGARQASHSALVQKEALSLLAYPVCGECELASQWGEFAVRAEEAEVPVGEQRGVVDVVGVEAGAQVVE